MAVPCVLKAPPAYVLGGTEFLLPGAELPQPWAACCPARTLAPLGFTHTTQCLHTDIFIKLKKVLVSCCVGCEAELRYLGGKKRPPGAVKISQASKIRKASMLVGGWIFTGVEEFQYRNDSSSQHSPSPT